MLCRTVLVLMIGVQWSVVAPAWSGQLNPPADNPSLLPNFDAIQFALKQQHPENAAALVDPLLRDHAADLLSSDAEPGLLVSVSARLRVLLNDSGSGLAGQYASQFDAAARAQLQSLRLGTGANAQTYYAIAQRYPRTPTAAAALGLAGDCAAATGDLPSALTYYRLAQSAGWIADKLQQQRMAAAEAAMKNPWYHGMVLFDAPWYQDGKFIGHRYFPFASGGCTFFVTSQRVLAFSKEGGLLWSWAITSVPPAPPESATPPANPQPRNRPPRQPMYDWTTPIGPNVLYAAGSPQVVVARDIQSDGTARLIALAASDGRLLWTTSDQQTLAQLSFEPSPVLSGQYVYDLATDSAGQPGTLYLLALNVNTGREMWRTALGAESLNAWQQRALRSPFDYTQPAGIVVDQDQLILSPNIGYVIAVDRFDGKIRWMRQYAENPPGGLPGPNPKERYDNVPCLGHGAVIVAGQDEQEIQALDISSGALVWESKRSPRDTLVGVAGNAAIMAGTEIDALDSQSGGPLWRYFPPKGGRLSGPPILFNGKIYIPTTVGPQVISAETAADESASAVQPPDLRVLLTFDAVRGALTADHVLESFTLPPAPAKPTLPPVKPKPAR